MRLLLQVLSRLANLPSSTHVSMCAWSSFSPCMPMAHDCIDCVHSASQSRMHKLNTGKSSEVWVMPVLQRSPLETIRCYAGAPAYRQPACCTICKTLVSYPSCCTIAAIRRRFSGSYGIRETSDNPMFLVCHLSTIALADPVLHAPFDGVVGGPALTTAHWYPAAMHKFSALRALTQVSVW